MTNTATEIFTEKQMKIIELLQDMHSNKMIKPSITDVVGYALEYLLFTELQDSKGLTRKDIDLITNEGLKNKLKDKHLRIHESESRIIYEIFKVDKNNTNSESNTPDPFNVDKDDEEDNK